MRCGPLYAQHSRARRTCLFRRQGAHGAHKQGLGGVNLQGLIAGTSYRDMEMRDLPNRTFAHGGFVGQSRHQIHTSLFTANRYALSGTHTPTSPFQPSSTPPPSPRRRPILTNHSDGALGVHRYRPTSAGPGPIKQHASSGDVAGRRGQLHRRALLRLPARP